MANLTSNQVCNICCIHYSSGLRCCAFGSLVQGGYLFAKQGGLAWIVARSSREVIRTWYNRNDAVTVAQQGNACGDWFVPSRIDLVLGQDCKSFWDSYTAAAYWSSAEISPSRAWEVNFDYGGFFDGDAKINNFRVRAFRRVSY